MTEIPGTTYSIQNGQILNPDGQAISKEAFTKELQDKGIILQGAALKVMGDTFGQEFETQLRDLKIGGVPMYELSAILDNTGEGMGDMLQKVMILIHKLAMIMKESSREIREANVQANQGLIEKQIDEMKNAAVSRLVTGLVTAGVQIGLGALQLKASAQAGMQTGKAAEINQQAVKAGGGTDQFKTLTTQAGIHSAQAQQISTGAQATTAVGQGINQAMGAIGEYVASTFDREAKGLEGDSVEMQGRIDQAKELMQTLSELEAKVREIVSAMEQAEAQANSHIANMS